MVEISDRIYAVVDAAREFKVNAIATAAKSQGVHDASLPDEDVSAEAAGRALVALFRALTELDGALPHEQPVIADLERELNGGS